MSKTNSTPTNTTQLSQKIIYLKSELAKYKAIVEDYENNYHYSQLRKLKLQNKELREEKETISLQLQDMYKQQKNAEENLKHEFYLKSEKLNETIVTQNKKINNLLDDNKDYQKEISNLKEKLEEYKKNNNKMKREMTSLNEYLKEKNNELEQLKENHPELLLENSKQKEAITDFQTTNESLQIDIENLSKENTHYKKEITELTNVTTAIKEDKWKLEKILKTEEQRSKDDKILLEKLNKQISNLERELTISKDKNEKLENEKHDLREENKIYKGKLEEATKNFSLTNQKQQVEIKQTKEKLNELRKELENVKKKYSDLKQENITLKSLKNHLEQDVEKHKVQNKYLMEKNEILKEKNENYSSLIKMNKELLKQNENIQNFQQQLVTAVNLIKEDIGSLISIINFSEEEDYEISELLVSILDHQFKKALENTLHVEYESNITSVSIHELESKLVELTKEIESTSNNIK